MNEDKYYWVKLKNKWVIAKWNTYFGMWHLFNDDWVPRDNITEIIEINEPK